MKKTLLLFTFICISNFIFSQTEKGTHFLGTSHISEYRSGETNFFNERSFLNRNFSFQYGLFIKDNVLVGANLSYFSNIVLASPVPRRGNSLALNAFYRRYFGQKKIKPFVEAEIGVNIFNGGFNPKAEISPGLAFFLNSNTSLDLSFNFLLLDVNDFISEGIIPEIGLALRFFLQYDNDNVPQIAAKDMIQRGVFSADFSSSYIGFDKTILNSDVGLKYFFLNNIYISGGLNFYNEKYPDRVIFRQKFNPRIGIGGYYILGDFTAFTIHANGQKSLLYNRRISANRRTVDLLEAEAKAGLALFLGRQKLELLAGIEYNQFEGSDVLQTQSDNNFVFTIGYEYFVSDKLSINTSFSAFPKNQKQRLFSDNISRFSTSYNERYISRLNVRLKWYINTMNLKKSKENE